MNFFKKDKVIFRDSNFEFLFTTFKELCKKYKSIKNWRFNRPVDACRVEEIKTYLIENKEVILPGILSAWEIDGELEIYDGFHRFSACCALNDDIKFIIRICNLGLDVIKKDFKAINQSISVPYLYLQENNNEKRKVIESIVQKFCERYPKNISPSRNCQKQNFNRDNFISLLQNLDVDYFIPNLDVKIYQSLLGINNQAKMFVKTNKIQTPNKCYIYDFFLFYYEPGTILTKIQEDLQT
jgi:hypothetical protein